MLNKKAQERRDLAQRFIRLREILMDVVSELERNELDEETLDKLRHRADQLEGTLITTRRDLFHGKQMDMELRMDATIATEPSTRMEQPSMRAKSHSEMSDLFAGSELISLFEKELARRGISASKAAEEMGMSRQHLSLYRTGKSRLGPRVAQRFWEWIHRPTGKKAGK